jgi:hypothetical protein
MTARRVIVAAVVAGCGALAGGGCGQLQLATVDTTCAQMRAQGALFRQQATLIVRREHGQVRAGSTAQAILGVELHLRRACRGARAGYRPYRDTAGAKPAGLAHPP